MNEESRKEIIDDLVDKWISIADKDLLTAQLLFKADELVTETVCFHCQQAVEKYLKAYLVKKTDRVYKDS